MDLGYRLLMGISLSKASKTPRHRTKKAPLASPLIEDILPPIEFNDLPAPPAKARSTGLLPPIPTTPPSAPSPSKRRSPVKQSIRRRARRAKEVIDEVIEPPETLTISGRRSKRRLFHDEVLAKGLANQKATSRASSVIQSQPIRFPIKSERELAISPSFDWYSNWRPPAAVVVETGDWRKLLLHQQYQA